MRFSKIKAKLSRNEPAFITTLHFTDPSLFELTSLMGFDGIWIDMEHHSTSVETSATLMRAARVGSSDIVARPAKGEFMRMCRMLEMGAQAIMYPRCSNAEEAAEVVRWAKFAPQGTRGADSGNADGWYCGAPLTKYIAHANEQTVIIIQLEDQAAVDQAEAIAAVDGVDALMLGPGDFSILEGIPGQMTHPKVVAATEAVARAAKNTGKHWGRPMFNVEDAKQCVELGARLCFHGADLLIVKRGLEAIQRDFSPLGFTFENRLLN